MRKVLGFAAASTALLLSFPVLSGENRPWGEISVGRSMAGQRITPDVPRPGLDGVGRVPNAAIFGDEPEERRSGRRFDDRYVPPVVRRSAVRQPFELRATQGRSDLNPVNAGAFARSGPFAAGASGATRIGRGH